MTATTRDHPVAPAAGRAATESGVSPPRVARAAAIASVVNLAAFAAARRAGADFHVRFSDPEPWSAIPAGQIVAASLMSVLVGGALVWTVARRSERWASRTRIAGVALAVVSASAPLSAKTADASTALILAAMHLVAGLAFWLGTRRR